MSGHMSGREGQLVSSVTLASLLVASLIASGLAFEVAALGVPWWIVAPVAWVAAYFLMRTILRRFFMRHMRSLG